MKKTVTKEILVTKRVTITIEADTGKCSTQCHLDLDYTGTRWYCKAYDVELGTTRTRCPACLEATSDTTPSEGVNNGQ